MTALHKLATPPGFLLVGDSKLVSYTNLADYIPTLEDLPDKDTLIVDGSLLTCWSWADAPELYSGKHRTTGLNVQVVTDLAGRRLYVSEPVTGKTHDAKGLRQSGILDHTPPPARSSPPPDGHYDSSPGPSPPSSSPASPAPSGKPNQPTHPR
jgi:hypothetical protein